MTKQAPSSPLLDVSNLSVKTRDGVYLLHNLAFTLSQGECLAIVGESGSGKTLTARALLGLCAPSLQVEGQAIFKGHNLLKIPYNHNKWSHLRGKEIAMVLQHGSNAFNPLFSIQNQVMETLKQHLKISVQAQKELLAHSFSAVALPNHQEILSRYPHELSGGTLQRIMIALALMLKSEIIIADEPCSSIDWISKKEVLGFFAHALHEHGQALLIITHDFAEVQALADKVLVLQNGIAVEQGSVQQVLNNPVHPYTRELIHARAQLDMQFAAQLRKNTQSAKAGS